MVSTAENMQEEKHEVQMDEKAAVVAHKFVH